MDDEKELSVTAKVEKGIKKDVKIIPENDVYVFSKKNEKQDIVIDFEPYNKIKAPIKKGDKVGCLIVYKDGVETGRTNALAAETVNKKTYFDYVRDVARSWTI